jgi:hypothetical protein
MDPHRAGQQPEPHLPAGPDTPSGLPEPKRRAELVPAVTGDPAAPWRPRETAAPARPGRFPRIVAGGYLLTVDSGSGSEVAPCPPEAAPVPQRLHPSGAVRYAAQAPLLAGPTGPRLPLLERNEIRERLVRLLGRGRSARVTGPSGIGRSRLLSAVAAGCADAAVDGVVQLSGYRRTPGDLLHVLFSSVYHAPGQRPERARLLALLREVAAVVVIDDVEFGGAALDELVAAAPECAFLFSATPDVPPPAAGSLIEEIRLPGLTRTACVELLEHAVDRPLEDKEIPWAADLWFESEGLPLRFVQAGALLRQREARRAELEAELEAGDRDPFDRDGTDGETAALAAPVTVPLPTLAESAAPATRLAADLSEAGREALRYAVALGGECPNPGHLPALVDDAHGDTALAELVTRGLALPVAAHYRLAAGVRTQLAALEDAGDHARTAAEHFTWWASHSSVPAARVASEAEVVLAAMVAARDRGHHGTAVRLARAAAPAFAAALHWSAWERALRIGQEAARLAGDVAQEAHFHHELGVLALCTGNRDRARAELEASSGLRGALGDRDGMAGARHTLALLGDTAADRGAPAVAAAPPEPVRTRGRHAAPSGRAAPNRGVHPSRDAGDTTPLPALPPAAAHAASAAEAVPEPEPATTAVISPRPGPLPSRRRLAAVGSRRNLAAAGAGVLLAAVLGTVVTLGATSETGHEAKPENVSPTETDSPDQPGQDTPAANPATPGKPSSTRPGSVVPGASQPPVVMAGTPQDPGTTGAPSSHKTGASHGTGGGHGSHHSAEPSTPPPSHSRSSSPPPPSSSSEPPSGSASPSPSDSQAPERSTSASPPATDPSSPTPSAPTPSSPSSDTPTATP